MFPIGQNEKKESWVTTWTSNNWEFLETRFWKHFLSTLEWHQVKETSPDCKMRPEGWHIKRTIICALLNNPQYAFLYMHQINDALVCWTWQATEPFAKVKNWELNNIWLPDTANYCFVPKRLVSVSGLFCKTTNINPTQSLLTNINSYQPSVFPFILYFFLFEEENKDWPIAPLVLRVRK